MSKMRYCFKIGIGLSILWTSLGAVVSLLSYHKSNLNIMGYAALVLMPLVMGWVLVFLEAWKAHWSVAVSEPNLVKAICLNLILKPICAIIYTGFYTSFYVISCIAAYFLFIFGYFKLLDFGFWGISTAGAIFGIALYLFFLFRAEDYKIKATWTSLLGFNRNKLVTDLLAFGALGVMLYLGLWAFFESNLPNTILAFVSTITTFAIASGLSIFVGIKKLLQDPFVLLGIVIIWYVNVVKNEILRALR